MHRTAIGDLQEPRPLCVIERTFEMNVPDEDIARLQRRAAMRDLCARLR
jgi:hypothetical protein